MSEINPEEREGEELVVRLNALVEELEQYPDTEVREKALELVQIILRLYGESLRRIIATFDAEPQRDQILGRMANDEVIRSIMLIHGLMPVSLYDRVAAKLSDLRPYLVSQGCDVELLGIDDARARMRLIRSGKGAPPIAVLKAKIENALSDVAPDLAGIEIEGLSEKVEATAKVAAALGRMIEKPPQDSKPALVQIKRKQIEVSSPENTWVPVIRSQSIEDGQFKIVNYEDINVLILNLDGEFYAYQNACADGGRSLDNSLFQSPMLNCSCHGYGYDLRRGNCIERPDLKLTPVPLSIEDQKVRIGLQPAAVVGN
ncbi:MAG: Rieske 2Fe-2S domain-containing protein [Acidobacteria bacterium]|nr:Rieske 2Fe-2S domain-containing protein [Acidobacteriota bacterium]